MQQRRHAMRERHLLPHQQADQEFGRIAAGIDLLDAEHGGDEREPPGVDVEHRRDRHVDVTPMHPPLHRIGAERGGDRQCVQHELPVREIDALRQSGGAGRVECRGTGILVEIGEFEVGRACRQQRLVFTGELKCCRWRSAVI